MTPFLETEAKGYERQVRRMAKLIYSMIISLDGYTEDEHGQFGWGAPDEAVYSCINELGTSFGTYLYGRRMYETMVYWETAHTVPNQSQFELDFARQWQATDKIVYSRTLAKPRSARTKIERDFNADPVRRLKADAERDMTVDGPGLAAHALRAGLVDELQMIVCPVVVGGGKRFFPEGARLDLDLIDERRFQNGWLVLRYAVRKQRT
jgi:dihydrofolate reductase